jgi:ferredoxin
MSEIAEHRVGRLTVRIDRHLCVGFGDCIQAAPEAFELDAEGIAVVKAGADAVERERLFEAVRACPVDALSIHDDDSPDQVLVS